MDKTEARIRLAIDAMGSDLGPSEILEGISLAVDRSPWNTEFVVFGEDKIIEPIISSHPILSRSKVDFVHSPEVVGMEEKPSAGIKGKKKSLPSFSRMDSQKIPRFYRIIK